jgi:hypothetical protein
MLCVPWPRRGRLLRHLCFSSSFPRLFNPGGQGHVKGARAHRAQRGLPLTWPRRDYIALSEEEEKRRSNRQPLAAARGRTGEQNARQPLQQDRWLPVREHWPCWRHGSTQPGSKRPLDQQRSAATYGGVGASSHHTVHLPSPGPRPARACAACLLGRAVLVIVVRSPRCPAGTSGGCRRTSTAQRRWDLPGVIVEEGVKGRAPGLHRDRAPRRLAPEEAVTPQPATVTPRGPCMARSAPPLLRRTRAGNHGRHVEAHGARTVSQAQPHLRWGLTLTQEPCGGTVRA